MAVVILETAFAGIKKTIMFLAGISIFFILFSGCIQEKAPSEESGDYTIYNYSTPGFEIDLNQAKEVWGKVNFSDDAKFVTREKNYSVIIFVQSYTRRPYDPLTYGGSIAEWIVVASSIPEKTEDVKIVIFRLDYATFDFKRSYHFNYPKGKEITMQQSIAVMEEELKKEPGMFQPVNESTVILHDGNYVYSYQYPDFGEMNYLFSWDEIPWPDDWSLTHYLFIEQRLHLPGRVNIEKIDNNRTIRVNSEGRTALLKLNEEKTKVTLIIDDGRTAELIAKMEKGKLNIYEAKTNKGSTIILNKYAGRIIFHAIFRGLKDIWINHVNPEFGLVRGSLLFPGEEANGTALLPDIGTSLESISSPAYRGTSTIARLSFVMRNNISNGSEVYAEYKKEMLHMNGSLESEPKGFDLDLSDKSLIPNKRHLIIPEGVNEQQKVYSNLTIKTDRYADEGDYFITITLKYRGWVVGKNVLSFMIGKGGGKSMTEGTWNIGYSDNNPPPIDDTEKSEMLVVAKDDTYLKGKKYKLLSITSEYRNLENFSGFFAVTAFDIGDPALPGEIIHYIIDREKKVILKSIVTPRKPLEYFRGEAFDEEKDNLTKEWNAENFSGFWRDPEENVSTETLTIDQSLLNNNYRMIDKHNLIYKTNLVPLKYQIYAKANRTPEGTDGYYQAIGWMGEKHVYLQGNRLAKIIFEQNASDVKTLEIMESWNMGEGYRLQASSIDAMTPEHQAWFTFFKDNIKLFDKVLGYNYELPPYDTLRYPELVNQNETPVFIAYLIQVYAGRYTDNADFKYAWLRSQKTSEIKVGQIYGIMEVTSIDNGIIELRNREQINLSPGNVVNLMGDFNIQVGDSKTSLSFHPFRVIRSV